MDPVQDPSNTTQKSGWRTSEFWLSVTATLIGAILASGIVPDESGIAKALGVVATILGVLGYQVTRAMVKSSGNKAAAQVESAKALAASQNPK